MQASRLAEHFTRVGYNTCDPMRGFVRIMCGPDAQPLKGAAAFAAARWQKTDEEKFFVGQPEAERKRAAPTDRESGTTGMWWRRQSDTRRWPGSDTSGIPASLTSAIFAPARSATPIRARALIHLCSW